MSMSLLYTIGTARSGKSTYAKKWLNDPEGSPKAVVCTDNIRLALHGKRFSSHAETMVFAIKHVMIKSLLLSGHNILVDGTHTTETSIKRLLEIDPSATPIVFDTPKEICQERAIATNQSDLIPVIERHYNNMQKLLDEGLENVHRRLLGEIEYRWGKDKLI